MTTTPVSIVDLDEVRLACLTSPSIEETSRPLAICLHGFPDSATTWRHLLPQLETAGWRVVAPYLRGYAPSSVPADGCTQTGASVTDVIALHEHFGGDPRAAIIGHDWGASIAYGVANHAPDRWARVVTLAVPPGGALGHALVGDLVQLKRSWYMFFFQHGLAEVVVAGDDMAFVDMLWADWSPGYDATADLPSAKAAIGEPAHLAAALGYYRAALGGVGLRDEYEAAQGATQAVPAQPSLYLHGTTDGGIGVEVAELARSLVTPNVTIEVVDGVGHFLHLEAPDAVGARIVEFLS